MAHDLFIDKLFVTDTMYVVFEQKSVGQRFIDTNDYAKVENEAEAIQAGKAVLSIDGAEVKSEATSLFYLAEIFVNHIDSMNVLNDGSDFTLELSLVDKMPEVKTKRVVVNTFSPNLRWA